MVPWPQLLAWALTSAVIILIPGPSVLFIIGRALALGRRGALLSVLGNTLGALTIVIAVALGVGAVIAQSVVLFTIVKVGGALYLVWLGIQAIRHRRRAAAAVTDGIAPYGRRRLLIEGFVVGVTNPKLVAFLIAVLPQFVVPAAGNVQLQLLVLGLVSTAIGWVLDSVWALAAGSARDWFARSPRRVERMSAAGGGFMIVLGGSMAISGAKA